MTVETSADVEALEGYTLLTLETLPTIRDAIESYRRALLAANGAPSDLSVHLADRSGDLHDLVDKLAMIDQVPAAFGAALRLLDRAGASGFDEIGAPTVRSAGTDATVLLAELRLAHPHASPAQLLASAFLGETIPSRPNVDHRQQHWTGVSADHAARALGAADIALTGATLMMPEHGKHLRWVKRARSGTAVAGVAMPGLERYLDGRRDHNLTTGDRIAGVATAVATDGVVPLGGAFVVGAAGGAVGGPLGATVGAFAGSAASAKGGQRLRTSRHGRKLEDTIARKLDERLGTAHDDRYNERFEVRPRR